VVVPKGYEEPLPKPAICVVVAPGQLSVPTGSVKCTTAPHTLGVLKTLILVGQVMDGAWLSYTVTVKLHVAVFPEPSVTL